MFLRRTVQNTDQSNSLTFQINTDEKKKNFFYIFVEVNPEVLGVFVFLTDTEG
jgi:hypothetical protein